MCAAQKPGAADRPLPAATTCLPPACRPLPQLRDADNLSDVADVAAQPTLLAVAAWFPARDRGTVRLIDNAVLGGGGS